MQKIFRLVPTTYVFDKNFSLVGTFRYCSADQIEKNEMDAACGTYGGEGKCIQGFGWET